MSAQDLAPGSYAGIQLNGIRAGPTRGRGESAMPTYVILMNWTDQGAKDSRDTLERARDFRLWGAAPRGGRNKTEVMAMSFTGVDSLDRSIDKANVWLADIDAGFGTGDRRLAYRVLRAWLHNLRDRLSVEVAAHFAAQLPELL
jgi:hypothetical protein